jgi:hypothetical protein
MALNRELLTQIETALERALLNTFSSSYRTGRSARPESVKDRLDEQRERSKQNIQSQKDARMAKNITEAQKNLLDSYRKATTIIEGEAENSRKRQRAYDDYVDALDESMSMLKNYTRKYGDLLGKSLYNQLGEFKEMSKNTHGLSSALAATQRNTSLFSAALIESFNEIEFGTDKYRAYMNQLNNAISSLDKSFLQQSDFIDEQTGKIKDSLSPEDYANIRKSLGEAQTAISENLGKLGIQNLAEFMKTEEASKLLSLPSTNADSNPAVEFQQSLLMLAKQLERTGYDFGQQLESPESIDWEKLADAIAQISKSTNEATTNLNKVARDANTLSGSMMSMAYASAIFRSKFIKPFIETGTILAAFAKSKDATIDIFKQAAGFNIASIPASFMDVQLASVRLGMSFDETVAFLQENKRALAIYGPKAGNELLGTLKPMFEAFGYSLKQASEIIGPAIEAGIFAGIDIRSGENLNKFIEESMDSFKNISSIVNLSAKEYMSLNAELLGTTDIQGMLLGMDRDRAEVYGKQLIALRDNYVQLGLSTQQAQELVRTQEAQKREAVTTRVREGAKGMVLAKQLGLGDEAAQRYFQLSMKGLGRTAEEGAEFAEISKRMGLAIEQQLRSAADVGLGSSMIQQTMIEALRPTGAAGDIITQGQGLSTAERANIQVTDKAAELARALGMGVPAISAFQNVIESVSSLIKNSLVIAAGGAAFSLTAVAVQALAASKALGLIGGKGVLGNLSDMIFGKKGEGAPSKAPGKGGGLLGKVLTVGKVGTGLAAIAGTTLLSNADIAGKVESATGSTGLGALSSVLANTAVGAGGGFLTGGPIGALMGGLFGLGSGIYSSWDNIMSSVKGSPGIIKEPIVQQPQPTKDREDINRNVRSSGIVNMVDTSANEKLQVIADNVVKIVGILQLATEEKSKSAMPVATTGRNSSFSLSDMNSIPSGLSYVTAS